jgi:hypothetical protein
LRVNGVDVIQFVEAVLNDRLSCRADRRAGDPDGLRAAWAIGLACPGVEDGGFDMSVFTHGHAVVRRSARGAGGSAVRSWARGPKLNRPHVGHAKSPSR